MEQQRVVIKQYGNVQNLIAAFAAIQSVQDKNFKMSRDFGEPYKVTNTGRCNTVCNAAGWIAQWPHFKKMGVKMEPSDLNGGKFIPAYKPDAKSPPALGYNALAYALEMDIETTTKMLSPAFYPEGEKTPKQEVLKRIKAVIGKAGGGDSLQALLKSQKVSAKGGKKAKKKAAGEKKAPKNGRRKGKKGRKKAK